MRSRASRGVLIVAIAAAAGALPAAGALGPDPGHVPVPDPAFLEPVDGLACTPDNPYEQADWGETVGPVQDVCERLRFVHGPITVKPGQNDALLVPVTIEKPTYDGYVKRFKPDLVWFDEAKGQFVPPPVHLIHLHHAVWLEAVGSFDYDNLDPFFAAGEEKTIGVFPHPYAFPVDDTDSWLLLYMVHNYTSQTKTVWLTYDVD